MVVDGAQRVPLRERRADFHQAGVEQAVIAILQPFDRATQLLHVERH